MTLADIVALLKEGGPTAIAALFIYLYMQERARNEKLQGERISDLKVSMESVHKSVNLLDEARTEMHRRVG